MKLNQPIFYAILLCLSCSWPMQAQSLADTIPLQLVDQAKYRVYYALSFVKDSTLVEDRTNGQTLLLIGKSKSQFIDYNSFRKDSIYNAEIKKGSANPTALLGQVLALGRQIQFKPILIKNFPQKGEYTFQEMLTSRSNYRYTDKDVHLDWKLHSDTKEIQSYLCKKATCSYRGRNYTAWYSPDIPLNEGPYVFGALPGLILELYDEQDHFHFSLNGLQESTTYDPIYLPKQNIVKSSRNKVRKIRANFKSNPASMLQTMGGEIKVSSEVMQKLQPKPYNPIELE